MKTPMEALIVQHPKRAGETDADWQKRLTAAGVARFYDRATVKTVQGYQAAQAECAKTNAVMIVAEPGEPTFAASAPNGGEPVTITRAAAKNVREYETAKELAARLGKDLVITD